MHAPARRREDITRLELGLPPKVETPAEDGGALVALPGLYFGDLFVSLQFTFEVSPFFGHFCFCDCCSFAPRDVSFCPLVGWLDELLELAGGVVEDGTEDGDEVGGVLWPCTAPQRIAEVIPKIAVMA